MRVEELLRRRDHVLIAFDGPVAQLPPAGWMTDRLRVLVDHQRLPRKVARTADPAVILAYAATIGPATADAVHTHLGRIEYELLAGALLTPGVSEACATMAAAGTQITVVSGLAPEATRMFLVIHGLQEHVRQLIGRTGPDRSTLPPAPDLIATAIKARAVPLESCLFVGGTDADLTAARAAGVDTMRHRQPDPPSDRWFDALSTLMTN